MAAFVNKWVLLFGLGVFLAGGLQGRFRPDAAPHPIHLSVTEINHNATDKTLEISCKLFTDDFEKVLAQNYKTKIDLTNPPDKAQMEKLVDDYVHKHLALRVDGKAVSFTALGFEKEQDAVYSYFQVDNVPSVKAIRISNILMYDLFEDQIGVMHVIVGGKRKSSKLDYPDRELTLEF